MRRIIILYSGRMNTWLLFAISAPVFWAFGNVVDSAIRRHFVKSDLAATWFLAISRLPLIAAIFLIIGFKNPGIFDVICMVLGGILWMYPFILYYKAMEFEEPSRIVLLLQIVPVFTAVIAFFALKEILTLQQMIAFISLLAGGTFASLKKFEGKWRLSKALLLILVASVFWAMSDIIFKKFEPDFNDFWSAFSFYFLGSFSVSIIMLVTKSGRNKILPHFKNLSARVWTLLSINQIISLAGSLAFAYALTLGKASLTAVIMGIQPLCAFIFSLILAPFIPEIHKEELDKKSLAIKGFSFVLVVLGLIALT